MVASPIDIGQGSRSQKENRPIIQLNNSALFAVWLENKGSDSLARIAGALQAWRKVKAWG